MGNGSVTGNPSKLNSSQNDTIIKEDNNGSNYINYVNEDTPDLSFIIDLDHEQLVTDIMRKEISTPLQLRANDEGKAFALDINMYQDQSNRTYYEKRRQIHKDSKAKTRVKHYMYQQKIYPPSNPTNVSTDKHFISTPSLVIEDEELRGEDGKKRCVSTESQMSTKKLVQPLPLLPLDHCPTFETRGISLRIIKHFAAEIRTKHIQLRNSNSSNVSFIDNTKVSDVFNVYVKPILERYDIQSLVELTDDDLDVLPTKITASDDICEATHYLIYNSNERFLDLANVLCKRFYKNDDNVYFWIDQFSMPFICSEQYPPKYFLNGLATIISAVPNIMIIFLNNDGWINSSSSTTGSPMKLEWNKKKNIFTQIECLLSIGIIYKMKLMNSVEIIQDSDNILNMNKALINDVENTLYNSFSFIQSITLEDQYKRTKYFQAAGFFNVDDNDGRKNRNRHQGVDYSAKQFLFEWLFAESKLLLFQNIRYINNSNSGDIGLSKSLTELYTFCTSMSIVLWKEERKKNNDKKREKKMTDQLKSIEILKLIFTASKDTFGTISSISINVANTLIEYLEILENWNELEPLLLLVLGEARSKQKDNDDKIIYFACKLSDIYVHQNRDDEALPLLIEGYGVSHSKTLECLQRKGDKLWLQNRFEKARQLYGTIIEYCNEQTKHHKSVLHSVSIIANYLLNHAGDRKQALALYRQLCLGHWNVYGPYHWETILSHRKIFMILYENRNMNELIPYLKVVDSGISNERVNQFMKLSIEKTMTENASNILLKDILCDYENSKFYMVHGDYYYKIRNNLITSKKSYTLSLSYLEKHKKNIHKNNTDPHELEQTLFYMLYLLSKLGNIEQTNVNLKEAKKYYKKYLIMCLNNETKEALQVTIDLAWVYTSLNMHREAEPHFRHHFVTQAKIYGDNHQLVNRYRSRLADCLEKQGRKDESMMLHTSNSNNGGGIVQSQVIIGSINMKKLKD